MKAVQSEKESAAVPGLPFQLVPRPRQSEVRPLCQLSLLRRRARHAGSGACAKGDCKIASIHYFSFFSFFVFFNKETKAHGKKTNCPL